MAEEQVCGKGEPGESARSEGAGAFGILFKLVVTADPSYVSGNGNSEITFFLLRTRKCRTSKTPYYDYANKTKRRRK